MSTRELIDREVAGLLEELQREVYDFARFLRLKDMDKHFNGLLLSESALAPVAKQGDVIKRFAAGLLMFFFLFSPTPGQSAEKQVLRGHIPYAVSRLQSVNRLALAKRLNLVIALPLRNREALGNLLQEIYDPTSPNYRQYLTPEQFSEQFGPTEPEYLAVMGFARSHGLTVTGTHPNRTLLAVSGSVQHVENAFHVTLRIYPHPTEARTFYAPDAEPSLDLAVPILEVVGLDDYFVPRPQFRKAHPHVQRNGVRPEAGSGPFGSYMGSDFRFAYLPGVTLTGAGQKVGLFELDGYYANDPVQYAVQTGLTNSVALTTLTNVLVDGFDGAPGANNVEVALDIEMVMSMSPGAQIIVYEGPNAGAGAVHTLNRMTTDNLAKQLSSSWSIPTGPATLQIFQQMAGQGQTFFNSSGDHGAHSGTVTGPKDVPYITIVGGTTLTTSGPGGFWVSETTWNGGNDFASGGGISTSYAIPNWQQGIDMSSNHGSTTMRNLPDVAMVADDVYAIADNGVAHYLAGTSVAAPLWAAFTALVNEKAALQRKQPVGFINPALYAIGKGTNYYAAFHDVTTGNNTNSSNPTNFFAVSGYDLCTGWGSPKSNLIDALLTVNFVSEIGWTSASLPATSWSSVACSADGTKIVAASMGGPIYVSSTSGATWWAGPSADWRGVASSADGAKLAAAPWNGPIYVSADYGVTWTPTSSPSYSWRSIASSADGTRLAAGAAWEGVVLVSTNSGSTWRAATGALGFGWNRVAWSADGNVLIAAGNQIYVWTNWATPATVTSVPGVSFFSAVTSSAAGSTLAAVGSSAICISTNFGTSWTVTSAPAQAWSSVACSADGRTLAAVSAGYHGTIHTSNDGGIKWTNTGLHNADWTAIACSADGSKLIAAHQNYLAGQVYTGFFPVPPSIWQQPVSQAVQCGLDAGFSVKASGTSPLSYQWYFGDTPLPGESGISGSTSSNLTLRTLALSQTGDYSIIVANPYGTASSDTVTLTVQMTNPPVLNPLIVLPDGSVQGVVTGLAGLISIEASTNLVDWETVTNIVLTNSPAQFFDSSATNYSQRFYRARVE